MKRISELIHHCFIFFSLSTCSSGREYRVAMGKHNLIETEEGVALMGAANIVVHEKWNPFFIR